MNEPINQPLFEQLYDELLPELQPLLEEAESTSRELTQDIQDAEADRQAAERAKEAAKTAEAYTEAKQAIAEAETRKEFYRSQLAQLNGTPRMSEDRYNEILHKIDRLMIIERNDARQACAGAMAVLKQVTDNYKALAAQLDELLEMLDAAANILQSKSPTKWRLDAVRYSDGKAEALFIQDNNPESPGRKDPYYDTIYRIVPRAYGNKD